MLTHLTDEQRCRIVDEGDNTTQMSKWLANWTEIHIHKTWTCSYFPTEHSSELQTIQTSSEPCNVSEMLRPCTVLYYCTYIHMNMLSPPPTSSSEIKRSGSSVQPWGLTSSNSKPSHVSRHISDRLESWNASSPAQAPRQPDGACMRY